MIGYALAVCVAMVGLLSLVALLRATGGKHRRERTRPRMQRELRETFEFAAQQVEPATTRPARQLIVLAAGTGALRDVASGTRPQREPRSPAPSARAHRHPPSVGLTAALALLEESSPFVRPTAPPTRYPRASTPPPVAHVAKPMAKKLPRVDLRSEVPRAKPITPPPPPPPRAKPSAPPPLPSILRPLPSHIGPVVRSQKR